MRAVNERILLTVTSPRDVVKSLTDGPGMVVADEAGAGRKPTPESGWTGVSCDEGLSTDLLHVGSGHLRSSEGGGAVEVDDAEEDEEGRIDESRERAGELELAPMRLRLMCLEHNVCPQCRVIGVSSSVAKGQRGQRRSGRISSGMRRCVSLVSRSGLMSVTRIVGRGKREPEASRMLSVVEGEGVRRVVVELARVVVLGFTLLPGIRLEVPESTGGLGIIGPDE